MDLLRTLVLYMTMIFAASVQNSPDAEAFMVDYVEPTPVVAEATAEPTPSPTPVPPVEVEPNQAYKTLIMGDKGEEVIRLQQTLAEYGYYTGEVDGRYGNQTRYAVERFQYCHGLVSDGMAGKYTQTVLYDSNQVRYAEPTPTPSPEGDTLTVAMQTPAPVETATAEPTEAPTPEPTPEPTAEPTQAPAAEPTFAPIVLTDTPEPTQVPALLAMEGWVIRMAHNDQPLVNPGKGDTTVPVLPYMAAETVYVPLVPVLEAMDVMVVASLDSVEALEIGFGLGEHLYRIVFTENQQGDPVGLEAYIDLEPATLPIADIRRVDDGYYLPVDSISALTGLVFELDETAQILTVSLPAGE